MTDSTPDSAWIDRRVDELLDDLELRENRDQLRAIFRTSLRLATDDADRLDLKITNAALHEMRTAFTVFAPYRHISKVTIFGSARTLPDDPLYAQARDLATRLADRDWMVITGAGPGIMAAGIEGAGRDRSFGVNIRLPFEQSANELIAGDDKLVEMRYFFTRKLMLIKESHAFVALPGGFGTLDETFELLTLQQTGKALPSPIVLLDVPGGTYWHGWERFVTDEAGSMGLISPQDVHLYRITDDVDEAVDEITGFYRNHHSIRFAGNELIIRLHAGPTDDELAELSEEFADLCVDGGIRRAEPHPHEISDDDVVHLDRIALKFDRMSFGRLRLLINRLNTLPSAPDHEIPPSADE